MSSISPISTRAETVSPTLAERVEERAAGACRVLTLQTPVRSVVSWRGSFSAFPHFADGDELLQGLTVMLLDKGTRRRDRFALAEVLENRGAQLDFFSEGLRVVVQGRALQQDLPDVLRVMAEELRQPLFDAAEFEKAKAQLGAALHRSLENTGTQASGALSRRLYDVAHPNYTHPTEETLARLHALTVEQVRAYHAEHFGARDLVFVLTGDVEPSTAEETLRETLGDWPAHTSPPAYAAAAAPQEPGRSVVPLPGKRNVDVRMGHALTVRRQDDDYMPLYLANHVLGGNFSARLMTKVRDEMGLTYSIHAGLVGVTTHYEGHWQVGVTLSQDYIDRGIEATQAEVRRFVEEGPTAEELRDHQASIAGSFNVGLATTGGLAATLHLNAVRGFDVAYLDRFAAEVQAVSLDQARDAMLRHFHPDAFHLALAGMLPES